MLCNVHSSMLLYNYTQGDGVGGAQVFVNGYLAAATDEEGSYTLSNITSGSYHLLVGINLKAMWRCVRAKFGNCY